jgi:hypothetical protein
MIAVVNAREVQGKDEQHQVRFPWYIANGLSDVNN